VVGWTTKEVPAASKLVFPVGIGQEAVASDPDEPLGQSVKQEPAEELGGFQAQGPGSAAPGVVLVAEHDLVLFHGLEPVVGDGDPMGVASQVFEDRIGPTEGRLGIDDPLDMPSLSQQPTEGRGSAEGLQGALEAEASVLEGFGEQGQELASEESAQHSDR
jgi:hypothetical protein